VIVECSGIIAPPFQFRVNACRRDIIAFAVDDTSRTDRGKPSPGPVQRLLICEVRRTKKGGQRLESFLPPSRLSPWRSPGAQVHSSSKPRAYANLPIGLNFLIAGYALFARRRPRRSFAPVSGANARLNTFILGYVRSLDLGGNSGSIGLVLPYAGIDASDRSPPRDTPTSGLNDQRFGATLTSFEPSYCPRRGDRQARPDNRVLAVFANPLHRQRGRAVEVGREAQDWIAEAVAASRWSPAGSVCPEVVICPEASIPA